MTFVDTNYFLRFLLADNVEQHQKAKDLFTKAAEGKTQLVSSVVVFFELYWVFCSFYQKNKEEVSSILAKIAQMAFVRFEKGEILSQALEMFRTTTLDLEDSYNLVYAKNIGVKHFCTFDQKLQKVYLAHG